MRDKAKFILFGVFVLGSILGRGMPLCWAENIQFQAEVDRNSVQLGEAIQLTLRIKGTQNVAPVQLPDINGFDVNYSGGPYKQFSWVNGQSTSSVSYKYSLFPVKTGQFQVPSLAVDIQGTTYRSDPITIDVGASSVSPPASPDQSAETGQENLSDRIMLLLESPRKDVYLNEVVPVKVLLLVSGLRVEYGETPEFDNVGITVKEREKPRQYQKVINGVRYNVVEFEIDVSPTRSGGITLGPARLGCNIIVQRQRDSFFGDSFFGSIFDNRERVPRTLVSKPITFEVKALPEKGRPSNFSNAVGDFRFDVKAGPESVAVGDPVTLKMTVRGQGNVEVIQLPYFEDNERFKVYDPIININQDEKTLEQVLIPKTDAVAEIPAIDFTYFDPQEGEYKTISKGPFPLTVSPADSQGGMNLVGLDSSRRAQMPEELGQDIVFIKKSPGRIIPKGQSFIRRPRFYVMLGALFLLWLGTVVYFKRSHKLRTDVVYAKKIRAPIHARKGLKRAQSMLRANDTGGLYDVIFKTFQGYLTQKFHIPQGAVSFDAVKKLIPDPARQPKVLRAIQIIFEECDRVRYSSVQVGTEDMEKSFQRLEQVIDYLERHIK
jgi:hypothetical protein